LEQYFQGPTKQLFWPQCPITYDLPMGLAFNPLEQSITMGWVPTFPMGLVLEEPHNIAHISALPFSLYPFSFPDPRLHAMKPLPFSLCPAVSGDAKVSAPLFLWCFNPNGQRRAVEAAFGSAHARHVVASGQTLAPLPHP
jgi:hypothetical protein